MLYVITWQQWVKDTEKTVITLIICHEICCDETSSRVDDLQLEIWWLISCVKMDTSLLLLIILNTFPWWNAKKNPRFNQLLSMQKVICEKSFVNLWCQHSDQCNLKRLFVVFFIFHYNKLCIKQTTVTQYCTQHNQGRWMYVGLIIEIPYLALIGDLWDTFYDYFEEKRLCHINDSLNFLPNISHIA